ncbi:MAG: UDP-N-acetylglucosamine 2-epimerase (hydrolyzing) [Candidatus Omnitrophica bacterium]|nr:UDP-N-acetylglucosamine 2-epimerase (hydrolyzing) [Candidatus Omnitrophota bacterium]
MNKRKICVFTGTRAEYGLLYPLASKIKKDNQCKLQLLVSGSHLSKEFGLTHKQIEKDGFGIDKKVDMALKSDTPSAVCASVGLGLAGFGKALYKLKPDILVVLGDRYEAMAVAIAAMILRIPIAHISGGEATFGLIDEAIRHSITKMSHLHFTSVSQYRKRVIQLGEDPKRVFNVGSLGLDNIRNMKLLSKQELEHDLNFKFKKHNFLVTFHPVTLENNSSKKQFSELLKTLDSFNDIGIIFTKANADSGGRIINNMIDEYVKNNSNKAAVFASLGQLKYFSLMKIVDAVIGNSSSGIIEAPGFKIPTINIGDRQAGRIKAQSIIDCKPVKKDILKAIGKIYTLAFNKKVQNIRNPYGDGRTARRILKVLKSYDLKNILKKKFYNID